MTKAEEQGMFSFFGKLVAIKAVDSINNPYAKATSPDELIVAHVIQSFAKDGVQSWKLIGRLPDTIKFHKEPSEIDSWRCTDFHFVLENKERDLRVVGRLEVREIRKLGFSSYLPVAIISQYLKINEVEVDASLMSKISAAFKRLSEQHILLEETAKRAKREMEENEKKWNLAEKLLGMKRLDNGALVPVQKAAEEEEEWQGCSSCRDTPKEERVCDCFPM